MPYLLRERQQASPLHAALLSCAVLAAHDAAAGGSSAVLTLLICYALPWQQLAASAAQPAQCWSVWRCAAAFLMQRSAVPRQQHCAQASSQRSQLAAPAVGRLHRRCGCCWPRCRYQRTIASTALAQASKRRAAHRTPCCIAKTPPARPPAGWRVTTPVPARHETHAIMHIAVQWT